MSTCDFTYNHYEKILGLIHNSNYRVAFFNEAYAYDKEIIIRHDIDVDLKKAYEMALMEQRHNIKATYFILVRSPFYNIFDKFNSELIKGILDLGHQIGLHFDEWYYGLNAAENLVRLVDSEVRILEDFFDTRIYAVSFHKPSQLLLQANIKLNNSLINTYDKDFIKGFKYISDSRRMWKEGCLCSFLEKPDTDNFIPKRIQALIHPIWWTDNNLGVQEIMGKFLQEKLLYLNSELERNIETYKRLL